MVGVRFGLNQTNKNNNMQFQKPQRIACRACDQIFSTPQTLISHMQSCHMHNELSPPTTLAGKPLSVTLNLASSAVSVAKTTSPSPSSSSSATAPRNPFLHQNLYNLYLPARNHVELNHYRDYISNFGRSQNGIPAPAPAKTQKTVRNNNNFMFRQPPQPKKMQFSPARAPPERGDRTLPLIRKLEHRSPEIYVLDDDSFPDFIDLTLKL